jgi:two-component system chemotaxis response regulator CheB
MVTEAIVIGASAGAIEALGKLLPVLEPRHAVPVIVVVHVPARQPSLLCELFAPRCALPVREPEDKQPVSPGIWFAPPDYHLLVSEDRSFAFSVDEPVHWSRPSIDVLFESAADVYGASLLALVLTGASQDGARGAEAVRRKGGYVAVQDPRTAEATMMPTSAIERATPQLVGTLDDLVVHVRSALEGSAEARR